jgi:trehalose-6-phosphate synthase
MFPLIALCGSLPLCLEINQVADVFVTTTVRDGLNRWPLEYVLAQSYMCNQDQSNSSEDGSGEGGGAPPRHAPGLMVLSEFTSCCRVLNGALHVNPWKVRKEHLNEWKKFKSIFLLYEKCYLFLFFF